MVITKRLIAIAIFLAFASFGNTAPAIRINSEGSGFRIAWKGETNRVYRLVSVTELGQSLVQSQTVLATITAAVANVSTFVLPAGPRAFYQVQKEAVVDGTMVLTNGQVLSGYFEVDYRTYATGTNPVAFVELVDILPNGAEKQLAAASGIALASGKLRINTAESPTAWHQLQLRVREVDRDQDRYGPYDASETVSVIFDNGLYYAETPAEAGYKLHYELRPFVQRGTWQISVYRPDGSVFRTANGTIETDTNANGVIEVDDAYINDGGLRLRNPGDQYPEQYFDVAVVINPVPIAHLSRPKADFTPLPDPASYTNQFTNYIRTVVKHRADYRLAIVGEQPGIIPADGTRTLFNPMMDIWWVGMGNYSPQWDLLRSTYEFDPLPSAEGWNRLDSSTWGNLNNMLAGNGAGGGGTELPTHVFTFSHGSVRGLGSAGNDPNSGVSAATLAALGYTGGSVTNATNRFSYGLSYFFPDACQAALGTFIPLMLIHNTPDEMSRSKMIKRGLFQHFGCGWKKIKTVGLSTGVDILEFHGTFVGWLGAKTIELDPVFNYAANTYRQADAYAAGQVPFIYFRTHLDYTMFGVPDGYYDE